MGQSIRTSSDCFAESICRGVMASPKKLLTADGYDLQFGTNVIGMPHYYYFLVGYRWQELHEIGHYYLTKQLLPVLLAGAQSENNPDKKVRVVNTSSFSHFQSPKFDLEPIKDGPGRKKYSSYSLYGLSKLVKIMLFLLVGLIQVIGEYPFRKWTGA